MDGQAHFTDFFLTKANANIRPEGLYYRIPNPTLSEVQLKTITMDRADKIALKTLKSLGDHDGYTYASKTEIQQFFNTPKTYKTK